MTEVKNNFKNKYENLNCDKCKEKYQHNEETQGHIYKCANIVENNGLFENIFKDTHETKTMKEILKGFLNNIKLKKIIQVERKIINKTPHSCGPCGEEFTSPGTHHSNQFK